MTRPRPHGEVAEESEMDFQPPNFHSIALSLRSGAKRGGKTTRRLRSETAPPSVSFRDITEGLLDISSPTDAGASCPMIAL